MGTSGGMRRWFAPDGSLDTDYDAYRDRSSWVPAEQFPAGVAVAAGSGARADAVAAVAAVAAAKEAAVEALAKRLASDAIERGAAALAMAMTGDTWADMSSVRRAIWRAAVSRVMEMVR